MRRDLAPLMVVALRAGGGSGPHAAAARQVVLFVLIAQMLAADTGAGLRPGAIATPKRPPAANSAAAANREARERDTGAPSGLGRGGALRVAARRPRAGQD